jgi:cyclohexanone monooxygenase
MPEEIEAWSKEPGWAKARRERLATISSGRTALKANDDFLSGKVSDFKPRKTFERELSPDELLEKQLNTNFKIMEQIRARVDLIVKDPKTAAALKPYYPYGCKRPTFHDEFLPAFNLPHVTLVDTAPNGVAKISPDGVVHDGVEYPVDVLIYATGFQWMATSTFNMITGRNGQTLRDKWKTEGVRTFLGIHSHGFPNMFIMSGPQGGGGQFNFTRGIEAHTDYVTWMLKTLRDRGVGIVDINKQAEDAYAAHCREADIRTSAFRDCLSYYNGEGNSEPGSLAYYGGPDKWHQLRKDAQDTLSPYLFAS